ncbi:hypothetical protein [Rhizobium sp.]|uniref:hypothetical protein n=1 Tax=Rhizobium sp. TaxID=391 RepID=UPI0028B231D3
MAFIELEGMRHPHQSIAETEHPALRRPTRQFTVEVRSSNRRSSLKPTSIWGDIDLKALVREAEAEIALDRSPVPTPVDPPVEVALEETVAPPLPVDDNHEQNEVGPEVSSAGVANQIDVALPVQVVDAGEEATQQAARPRKIKPRRRPARTVESVPAVVPVDQTDVEQLLAENHELKLLLRRKLLRDNALLRDMLDRN